MTAISTEDFIKKYQHVNFQKMARTESSPRIRERLLGFHNLMIGKNRIESAAAVGRNPEWLRMWVLRYDEGGYKNLVDKEGRGSERYLTKEQEEKLVELILELQDERDGGRVIGKDIGELIKKEFNVEYKKSAVYDLLERIGLSWVSARSKHPKSDIKKQKSFKQIFKARMSKIKTKKKAT